MWPWAKKEKELPPRYRDVLQRLEDLEAEIDYLKGAMKKLRGHVTGAERRSVDEAAAEESVHSRLSAGNGDSLEARIARGDFRRR